MTTHARLSPSSAHRWLRCPASVALCETVPARSSVYADEGTAAHLIATRIVDEDLGDNAANVTLQGTAVHVNGTDWPVTQDMIDGGLAFRELIMDSMSDGAQVFTDQRVDFSEAIGVPDSYGTADALVIGDGRMVVIDYKYGAGVLVNAEENEQLMLYALGAMHTFNFLGPYETVELVIHQPRAQNGDPISRWTISADDLRRFAAQAAEVAEDIVDGDWSAPRYSPGEKQCKFCDAKAVCPALADEVLVVASAATADDFNDLGDEIVEQLSGANADTLALQMGRVALIESWCAAVRAEVERRLLGAEDVPGYKLVEGRKGNRKWADPDEAARLLASFGKKHEDIYDYALISPATAEKMLKGEPEQVQAILGLTTRAPGKPSVAPATDKRPALAAAATADDFD